MKNVNARLTLDPPPRQSHNALASRRARSIIFPSTEDGQSVLLHNLSRRSYPTLDFFVYAILSGIFLAVGFLLDSQAVLVFGVLTAPVLTSWVGLSIATVTGSPRFFAQTFAGIFISFLIVFLISLVAGIAERLFEPRIHNEIYIHSQSSWPSLVALTFGVILLVITFVRTKRKPYLPSAALAYALYLPISAAGFGAGANLDDVWPQSLLVALSNFSWATLVGILLLSILRFRPRSPIGHSFRITIVAFFVITEMTAWQAFGRGPLNLESLTVALTNDLPPALSMDLPQFPTTFSTITAVSPTPIVASTTATKQPSIAFTYPSASPTLIVASSTATKQTFISFTHSSATEPITTFDAVNSLSTKIPTAIQFTPTTAGTATSSFTATLPLETRLNPDDWMDWPVLPNITQNARDIYEHGQSLGNDADAFSIFGDCQSVPDIFLGPYVTDTTKYTALPISLQETVNYFHGSLTRESPTSQAGTTSGALLWSVWHKNQFTCSPAETPMDCELRIHKPSFVLIMVGTHWEGARNEFYMRKILDGLINRGVVPILATKADNREGDNRINLQTARLAAEYNLPLWNFWAAPADLSNRGLYTKKSDQRLGDIYLTDQALELHRFSALQVLDLIRRAVADGGQ